MNLIDDYSIDFQAMEDRGDFEQLQFNLKQFFWQLNNVYIEILDGAAQGKTFQQIGESLGFSKSEIADMVKRMRKWTNTNSIKSLVYYYGMYNVLVQDGLQDDAEMPC